MTWFITRVVLHGATDNDYDLLHAEMQKRGFDRVIESDEGKPYWLPQGTYFSKSNFTADKVRELADDAAESTHDDHAVFVALTPSIRWRGLKELTPLQKIRYYERMTKGR